MYAATPPVVQGVEGAYAALLEVHLEVVGGQLAGGAAALHCRPHLTWEGGGSGGGAGGA